MDPVILLRQYIPVDTWPVVNDRTAELTTSQICLQLPVCISVWESTTTQNGIGLTGRGGHSLLVFLYSHIKYGILKQK